MHFQSFRRALRAVLPLLALAAMPQAAAQAYPDRPLRLVVGFAPGGGTDVLARLIAMRLSERLGQPVTVENRPGGNMIIGMEAVAKAPADGYTIGMAATPTVTNPALYAKLPFDTAKDFTWVTQLTTSGLVLLAHPDVPAATVKDVIALAKRDPGKLVYGSSGNGGSVHLSGVMFEKLAGIGMTHVAYKGNGPAITDLLAGRVAFVFGDIPQVAPYIKSGKLKALAVTTQRRVPSLPEVPSMVEAGVPGYEVPVWYGVLAPANLPRPITALLAREMREVMNLPSVREQFTGWGVQAVGSAPEEFDAFIRAELSKWAGVIKSANIRLD